jgi:hypothetical protein
MKMLFVAITGVVADKLIVAWVIGGLPKRGRTLDGWPTVVARGRARTKAETASRACSPFWGTTNHAIANPEQAPYHCLSPLQVSSPTSSSSPG